MISGFELVTCRFELVTHGFELVTCRFELVTRGFELVTRNSCFTFPRWRRINLEIIQTRLFIPVYQI